MTRFLKLKAAIVHLKDSEQWSDKVEDFTEQDFALIENTVFVLKDFYVSWAQAGTQAGTKELSTEQCNSLGTMHYYDFLT